MANLKDPIKSVEIPRKHVIEHPFSSKTTDVKKLNFEKFIEITDRWPNSQTWPFKAGLPMIATSIALTGMFINNHFRKSLLLLHYSRLSSYLATVVVPTFSGTIVFSQFVSADIIEQKTKCPVCVQTRAAALQFGFGVLYPILLTPLVNFPTAGALTGTQFPKLTRNTKEVIWYAKEIMQPIMGKVRVISLIHILLAMGVTYFQQDFFYSILLPIINDKQVMPKPENIYSSTQQSQGLRKSDQGTSIISGDTVKES